jgi:hypothetical protein
MSTTQTLALSTLFERDETELPRGTVPAECRWDVEALLADEEDAEPGNGPA